MAKDYKFNKDEQIKCPICGESANYREFPDVVRLLESEKYRQMWEEVKNGTFGFKSYDLDQIFYDKYGERFREIMDWVEQKYFPKKASQDYKEGEE